MAKLGLLVVLVLWVALGECARVVDKLGGEVAEHRSLKPVSLQTVQAHDFRFLKCRWMRTAEVMFAGHRDVQCGNTLTKHNVQMHPVLIKVNEKSRAWAKKEYLKDFFSVVVVDVDYPHVNNPDQAGFAHWVVLNVPGQSLLNGKVVENGKLGGGEEIVKWVTPKPGLESHRYGVWIFRQRSKLRAFSDSFDEMCTFSPDETSHAMLKLKSWCDFLESQPASKQKRKSLVPQRTGFDPLRFQRALHMELFAFNWFRVSGGAGDALGLVLNHVPDTK